MRKISVKGVILGSLTDIISTNVLMIPLMIYVIVANDLTSLPETEIQGVLTDTIKNDQLIYPLSILLGSLCSMLGGYVAAKIAKHDELLNGALASILCVASGIYAFISGSAEGEYIKHIVLLLSSPLLATAGGYLRLQQTKASA